MFKEIGSEFWIDKSKISKENHEIPSWINKFGDVVLTSSGRGALSLILDQVNPRVKIALLPSYICDSVILPFEKAGYELRYYNVDKDFKPIDIDNITNADIGIFLHMGYFGFFTNEVLDDMISKLKSLGVIIIEDVTHTLFSNHLKLIENDFVVGSIRKWFGIPSGGFLASSKSKNNTLPDMPNDFIKLRTISLHQKLYYIKSKDESIKETYLSGFRRAEQILDDDVKPYKIDETSEMIIKNIEIQELISSRRTNFEYLSKHLNEVKGIEVLFSELKDNETPMFFPVYVNSNRNRLRSKLISKEIYCPIHWPISFKVGEQLSSVTKEIFDSILSIPCDQRYSIEDMQRVITSFKELI